MNLYVIKEKTIDITNANIVVANKLVILKLCLIILSISVCNKYIENDISPILIKNLLIKLL